MMGENAVCPLSSQACQDGGIGIQPPLASRDWDHTHLWGAGPAVHKSNLHLPLVLSFSTSVNSALPPLGGDSVASLSVDVGLKQSWEKGCLPGGLTASGLSPGSQALLSGCSSLPTNPSAVLSEYI